MKKLLSTCFAIGLLFWFFTSEVNAQVIINEISPSEEWVELYNPSSTDINLDGCVLLMGSASQDVNYTSSDTILALGFKVAEKDVTTEWTGNWLNNSGDAVTLDCPSVGDDAITYGDNVDPKTYGRSPNGSGSFIILESATKGSANSAPQPTPTPTPTPTSTSTATTASTPTPTPIKTVAPTPTKSPTPRPILTIKPTPTPEVLGDSNQEASPDSELGETSSSEPSDQVKTGSKKSAVILGAIFTGLGVFAMGIAGYAAYAKSKSSNS